MLIFVSETYEVQDWEVYDTATSNKSSKYIIESGLTVTHDTDHYVLTGTDKSFVYEVNGDKYCEVWIKQPSQSGQSEAILSQTNDTVTDALKLQYSTSLRLIDVTNGSQRDIGNSISESQSSRTHWHKFIFEIRGNNITAIYKDASDNTLLSSSTTKSLSPIFFGVETANASPVHVKNFKIKPL